MERRRRRDQPGVDLPRPLQRRERAAIFVDGYDNGYNPDVNVNEKLPGGQLFEDITRPEGFTQERARPPPAPPRARRRSRSLDGYPWSETGAALSAMETPKLRPIRTRATNSCSPAGRRRRDATNDGVAGPATRPTIQGA